MLQRILSVLIGIIVTAGMPGSVLAGGPIHGARAAGMGTAFVGAADDPSAVLFNPGGLKQGGGTRAYLGLSPILPSTTYTSPDNRSETTESQAFLAPHLYVVSDLGGGDLAAGLGVYSLYGIGGTKWSRTGMTRYASTESLISTLSVNPTVAWQVKPGVAVAAGVDYVRADIQNEKMLDQTPVGAGDAILRLEADGHGWGYNLGAHFKIGNDLRMGLAYRSKISVEYSGDLTLDNIAPVLQPSFGGSSYTTGVKTQTHFPDIYSIGVAEQATEKLLVVADIELVRWSSFNRISLDVQNEVPAAGLTDSETKLGWKDSWQIKTGLEYAYDDRLKLRCGYAFLSSAVPDSTLGPDNPDANQHYLSIGAGYGYERITVDLFYSMSLYPDRHVDNAVLAGTYNSRTQYAGISLGMSF